MSRSALRVRTRRWVRPPLWRRVLWTCWNVLRVLLMAGAALGPAMPPPPPPPRPTANMEVAGGPARKKE